MDAAMASGVGEEPGLGTELPGGRRWAGRRFRPVGRVRRQPVLGDQCRTVAEVRVIVERRPFERGVSRGREQE